MAMDGEAHLPKRRPSGERRSKQVLDAAEACVQRLGFHNASMAEIAAAAGMSVGHIYRYFPSKVEIIVALVERDAAEALREIEALARGPGCVHAAFEGYLARIIERMTTPGRVAFVLEVAAEAARNPRVADVVRVSFDAVEARLFDLLDRGRAAHVAPETLRARVQALQLVFCGLPMKAVKAPDFDRQAMASFAAGCILDLLAPPDEAGQHPPS